MRVAFIITTSVIGILIAYGYPFVAILRGRPVFLTIGKGWALVFLYMLFLCFLLPMLVSLVNRDLAKEMLNDWVPEGPSVVAAAFMGWLPALMGVAIGMVAKAVLNGVSPALSKRIEDIGKKPNSSPTVPQEPTQGS